MKWNEFFIIWISFVLVNYILNQLFICVKDSMRKRGRDYYKVTSFINVTLGIIGIYLINTFLRGKDIVPNWAVWTGLIIFLLIAILGMIQSYMMWTSLN